MSSESPDKRILQRRRDGSTLAIIGGFFTFFSILVGLGLFWERRPHGLVVTVAASLALLGVGLGMLLTGLRWLKKTSR